MASPLLAFRVGRGRSGFRRALRLAKKRGELVLASSLAELEQLDEYAAGPDASET